MSHFLCIALKVELQFLKKGFIITLILNSFFNKESLWKGTIICYKLKKWFLYRTDVRQ